MILLNRQEAINAHLEDHSLWLEGCSNNELFDLEDMEGLRDLRIDILIDDYKQTLNKMTDEELFFEITGCPPRQELEEI
jgi:hypothetical protein